MIVIALASQKGGSGKTTLSGHLAVEAERAGAGPVTLIDTDPQGSLSQWWNARAASTPQFAKIGTFQLAAALEELERAGTRLAIVDTPPAISEFISVVIGHCDLVIVPTRPSPHDLRAVAATVDMAERCGKPLIFVINGATQRARITGEAAVALSQHGVVAPVNLHHRVDFAASMIDGRTVGEVAPKSASAKEVADLWLYIQSRVAKIAKDPALIPEFQPQQFALAGLSGAASAAADEAPELNRDEFPITGSQPGVPQNGDQPSPRTETIVARTDNPSSFGNESVGVRADDQPRNELQQPEPARRFFGRPEPVPRGFGRRQTYQQ